MLLRNLVILGLVLLSNVFLLWANLEDRRLLLFTAGVDCLILAGVYAQLTRPRR